jgi:hypothetical protein
MKNVLFNRDAMCINRRWDARFNEQLDASPKDFDKAMDDLMFGFITRWWENLDESVQNAIRVFKFSHTLITGQMFFSDNEECNDDGFFMTDYGDFANVLLTYFMTLAHNEDVRDEVKNGWGFIWNRARDILTFEEVYRNKQKDCENLIARIHNKKLREEVLKDLLDNDNDLIKLDESFSEWITDARSKYLADALNRLAKEQRG